jgi:DNA-binding beta-propeller fold protein YncE
VSTLADMVAQWLISGLKIGVSSRGLGTVSQMGGKIIVNDDYEIVCWDVVSQPSTPMAWIDTEEKNLKPYIEEGVENADKPTIVEDKFSKFDDWLKN